jgi:hypothetical protein
MLRNKSLTICVYKFDSKKCGFSRCTKCTKIFPDLLCTKVQTGHVEKNSGSFMQNLHYKEKENGHFPLLKKSTISIKWLEMTFVMRIDNRCYSMLPLKLM